MFDQENIIETTQLNLMTNMPAKDECQKNMNQLKPQYSNYLNNMIINKDFQ